MNLRKSALMLSFIALMIFINTSVWAIDMSQTKIIKYTGKVSIKRKEILETKAKKLQVSQYSLLQANEIKNDDTVRTHANSSADVVLKDTAILLLKEHSIFQVLEDQNENDSLAIKAQQGSILFKIPKDRKLQVQTAEVICDVRGAMFSVTKVNDFSTMLEIQGIQFGYANEGGTEIKVYEGEVEVVNKSSNEIKSLKAGEGTTFFPPKSTISSDVMKVKRFNPSAELHKYFNTGFDELLKATGLESMKKLDILYLYSSSLEPRISFCEFAKKISNSPKKMAKVFKDLIYRADFSRFNLFDEEKAISYQETAELYIGKNTFAVCIGDALRKEILNVEPGLNGLFIPQGNGSLIMHTFNDYLKKIGEVRVSFSENFGSITIGKSDKKLSWRNPDTLEIENLPKGNITYHFDKSTQQGKWEGYKKAVYRLSLSQYLNFDIIRPLYIEKSAVESLKKIREATKETSK